MRRAHTLLPRPPARLPSDAHPPSLCPPPVAREANQALAQAAAAKQPANGWLIDERARYSAFRRALAFDAPLDPASISARMADGQLKVTVAKQGEGGEGLVDVKVE